VIRRVCLLVGWFVSLHLATGYNGRWAEGGSAAGGQAALCAAGGGGSPRTLFLVPAIFLLYLSGC